MTKQEMITNIQEAYCWEGDAYAKIVSDTDTEMELKISGSSTVEHSGDVDGIKDQVRNLKGKSFKVDGVWHEILNATCKTDEQPHGDSDYEVDVNGTVTIKKRKE